MEKHTPADHPIHEMIRKRWSPLAFSQKPVDRDALCSLLEAARWAASSFNEQPWAFLVATRDDPDEHERMLNCLTPGNRVWAKSAPVLMISVAKLNFDRNGKPNRHALHDVGQAVANLATQATSMGHFVHQMGGFDRERARETFSIPDGFEPVAAIAVGYHGDPGTLPDNHRKRELSPRSRRPIRSFVYTGEWGSTPGYIPG